MITLKSKISGYIHKASITADENGITIYSYTDGHFYKYNSIEILAKCWEVAKGVKE